MVAAIEAGEIRTYRGPVTLGRPAGSECAGFNRARKAHRQSRKKIAQSLCYYDIHSVTNRACAL
jgi:hypothetical protein